MRSHNTCTIRVASYNQNEVVSPTYRTVYTRVRAMRQLNHIEHPMLFRRCTTPLKFVVITRTRQQSRSKAVDMDWPWSAVSCSPRATQKISKSDAMHTFVLHNLFAGKCDVFQRKAHQYFTVAGHAYNGWLHALRVRERKRKTCKELVAQSPTYTFKRLSYDSGDCQMSAEVCTH